MVDMIGAPSVRHATVRNIPYGINAMLRMQADAT